GPDDPVPDLQMAEAVRKLEARIEEIRQEGLLTTTATEESLRLGQIYMPVREILRHLESLRENLIRLLAPRKRKEKMKAEAMPDPSRLDPFWMRNAVRGGLVFVMRLLFIQWTNAPGAAVVCLGACVLTILTRSYLSGQGDLRAFHLTLLF